MLTVNTGTTGALARIAALANPSLSRQITRHVQHDVQLILYSTVQLYSTI